MSQFFHATKLFRPGDFFTINFVILLIEEGIYDVVIGNDFLIYVTNFGALAHTLKQILGKTKNAHFYMCSTRHVETEPFFTILRQNGFTIEQPEPKIWDIYLTPPIDNSNNNNNK